MMQEEISDEVARAKTFSNHVDATQDITSIDQCSFVIQYVLDDCIVWPLEMFIRGAGNQY